MKLAALALRALLFDVAKLEAIPLLEGGTGMALWIPFGDAPQAAVLRSWLHRLCNHAVVPPDLVSTAFNTHPRWPRSSAREQQRSSSLQHGAV